MWANTNVTLTYLFCRLRNDLYCVEWDVKLYYTIPYLLIFDPNTFWCWAMSCVGNVSADHYSFNFSVFYCILNSIVIQSVVRLGTFHKMWAPKFLGALFGQTVWRFLNLALHCLMGQTHVSYYCIRPVQKNLTFGVLLLVIWLDFGMETAAGTLEYVQSSSQITTASIPTQSLYGPAALPTAQPTVSKHWMQLHGQKMD